MQRRIAVRGIVFRGGEMLAQTFRNENGDVTDWWGTPGGGLDPGESVLDCLHREMIEETGVAPKVGNLLFIQQFHDNGREHLELFYHITNHADYENVDLQATSHGFVEHGDCRFIDPKQVRIRPDFLSEIDLGKSIERGDTQTFNYLTVTT